MQNPINEHSYEFWKFLETIFNRLYTLNGTLMGQVQSKFQASKYISGKIGSKLKKGVGKKWKSVKGSIESRDLFH